MTPELTQAWLNRILYAVSWRQDMEIQIDEIRLSRELRRALAATDFLMSLDPASAEPDTLFGCPVAVDDGLDERDLMFEVLPGVI